MSNQAVTLSTLTTEIASSLKKELDEPFKRLLAQKVDAWRSRLLRNSLQEKPQESKFFRQTIYVPMEAVNPLPDCYTTPVCTVLQSTTDIPLPLRYGNQLFDYIGSIDGKNSFSDMAPGTQVYLEAGKYSRHTIHFSLINRRVQISNNVKVLPMIRIDHVFDKPSEVMQFNCTYSGDCDYWNKPYPVTGDIAQMIVQSILQVDYNQGIVPSNKEIDVNPQHQEHAPDGR